MALAYLLQSIGIVNRSCYQVSDLLLCQCVCAVIFFFIFKLYVWLGLGRSCGGGGDHRHQHCNITTTTTKASHRGREKCFACQERKRNKKMKTNHQKRKSRRDRAQWFFQVAIYTHTLTHSKASAGNEKEPKQLVGVCFTLVRSVLSETSNVTLTASSETQSLGREEYALRWK